MNRDIKFRGKDIKSGEWLYGDLVHSADKKRRAILVADRDCYDECEVQFDTLGQYTGLTDSAGKEIYEGDILRYGGSITHVVEFKHGMFGYTLADGWFVGYGGNSNFTFNPLDKSKEHEIIGNVFDNPELIPNQPTAI